MEKESNMAGYRRSYLLRLAHSLKPTVMIGQKGYSESVVRAVGLELDRHELIKVKFLEYKEEKRELADRLAADTSSMLVRILGNIAILYRKHPDPEKRFIVLPDRKPGR